MCLFGETVSLPACTGEGNLVLEFVDYLRLYADGFGQFARNIAFFPSPVHAKVWGATHRTFSRFQIEPGKAMKRTSIWKALFFFVSVSFAWTLPCDAHEKDPLIIMGWVEVMRISPDGPYVKAKLDTGALTSSLHARDMEYFKKDGQKMIRFLVDVTCVRTGEKVATTFERPLKRNVRIRQHQRQSMRRPVVTLDFCIGGRIHSTQFSLTDRSNFNYPVLLGRRFLKDGILVDSGQTCLMFEVCPEQ